MRIRLLHSYSGALTNERRMPAGEHEVTEVFGAYLITNGHAVDITPVSDGREDTEDIAITLTLGELDTEDAPVSVEPLPLAVDVDLDTLQVEGEVMVTHDDGSTSTVSIADDIAHDVTTLTRAEIMELLDEVGAEYNPRDNKDTLLALLESYRR